MSMKIFKLSFSSLVHFGNKRLSDSDSTVAADTLFSALFIEAINLKKDCTFLLEDVTISDAFPYIEERLYLPKPLIRITSQHQDDTNYKVFKKLKYLPADSYSQYIDGSLTSDQVKEIINEFDFGKEQLQSKVSLEKQGRNLEEDSEPYSVGTFQFAKGAGLYFIAVGSETGLQHLEEILASLQYSGIGGKRYVGYGRFTYEIIQSKLFRQLLEQKGNKYVLLSTAMAAPKELEECCQTGRYLLKKRTGFVQSTTFSKNLVKKKDFYSFAAGSVFEFPFIGKIYDVGENGMHAVYRYAKALWLGVSQ